MKVEYTKMDQNIIKNKSKKMAHIKLVFKVPKDRSYIQFISDIESYDCVKFFILINLGQGNVSCYIQFFEPVSVIALSKISTEIVNGDIIPIYKHWNIKKKEIINIFIEHSEINKDRPYVYIKDYKKILNSVLGDEVEVITDLYQRFKRLRCTYKSNSVDMETFLQKTVEIIKFISVLELPNNLTSVYMETKTSHSAKHLTNILFDNEIIPIWKRLTIPKKALINDFVMSRLYLGKDLFILNNGNKEIGYLK
jgi:hypothetical protein